MNALDTESTRVTCKQAVVHRKDQHVAVEMCFTQRQARKILPCSSSSHADFARALVFDPPLLPVATKGTSRGFVRHQDQNKVSSIITARHKGAHLGSSTAGAVRAASFKQDSLQVEGTRKKSDRQCSSLPSTPLGMKQKNQIRFIEAEESALTRVHGSFIRTQCMGRAQEKGVQFWQTRSHATILHDSVPADSIENVVDAFKETNILYQRIPTPLVQFRR